jgi:hypothetical protein
MTTRFCASREAKSPLPGGFSVPLSTPPPRPEKEKEKVKAEKRT